MNKTKYFVNKQNFHFERISSNFTFSIYIYNINTNNSLTKYFYNKLNFENPTIQVSTTKFLDCSK